MVASDHWWWIVPSPPTPEVVPPPPFGFETKFWELKCCRLVFWGFATIFIFCDILKMLIFGAQNDKNGLYFWQIRVDGGSQGWFSQIFPFNWSPFFFQLWLPNIFWFRFVVEILWKSQFLTQATGQKNSPQNVRFGPQKPEQGPGVSAAWLLFFNCFFFLILQASLFFICKISNSLYKSWPIWRTATLSLMKSMKHGEIN